MKLKSLVLEFHVNDNQTISLVNFSTNDKVNTIGSENPNIQNRKFNIQQPVEMKLSGINSPAETHGPKYSFSAPGYRLTYLGHKIIDNEMGQKLIITQMDSATGVYVTTVYQTYANLDIVRVWSTIENKGDSSVGLEYVSSFSYIGIDQGGLNTAEEKLRLHLPHNAWQKELDWQEYRLSQLGMSNSQASLRRSSNLIQINNTGNWSTKHFLPIGILENLELEHSYFWQIENNGSWTWEIGDQDGQLYLRTSGPSEQESSFWKEIQPGESFTTVKAAVGCTNGGADEAIQELVKYRRRIRRKNSDNQVLPVIFNDYMNSLFGDPTTEKEIPMIDKAAEAGCEYYCIDCGWYSDGYWWDTVGEWREAVGRFPNGLKELTDYVTSKGMVPGLWLEIEVIGINSPLFKKLPTSWFFQRHGKPVFDRSRVQLDFRNKEVRDYCTGVVERLINEYGIGYIKMDYNIDAGIGTDLNADSAGEGLLEHNRAYLRWLDDIFLKHPDLVIENCSSGGLRMDYAMLSRYSIQSTSDQEDFRNYATIACNAASGVNSEQAAMWSYPLTEAKPEEVIFNMNNALLSRIHQSGHLAKLSQKNFDLVKEGITVYRNIRPDIKQSLPFWPLGFASYEDEWLCYGEKIEGTQKIYLTVWRRYANAKVLNIPLDFLLGKEITVSQIYPVDADAYSSTAEWNKLNGLLMVELPERLCSRTFKIEY